MTEEEKKNLLNITATEWYYPKVAGCYSMGTSSYCFNISLTYKPNIIHRFFMKLLLGFTWRDAE